MATGTRPVGSLVSAMKNKVPDLHIIGDAVSPRKVKEAIEEGFLTAFEAAGFHGLIVSFDLQHTFAAQDIIDFVLCMGFLLILLTGRENVESHAQSRDS